jgi:hypothetical protein
MVKNININSLKTNSWNNFLRLYVLKLKLMKTRFFTLGSMLIIMSAVACNNGTSTTTSDSTTVTTGQTQTDAASEGTTNRVTVHFDPSASYVDLKTGKSVKLRVDTVTKYVINEVTSEPVMFYINPATNDTFDQRGRLVNGALVKNTSGNYTVDESRLTDDNNSDESSTDSSDNSADTAVTALGNSKTKIKDDKFKQKTDTTSVKVKNNKVKIKTRAND